MHDMNWDLRFKLYSLTILCFTVHCAALPVFARHAWDITGSSYLLILKTCMGYHLLLYTYVKDMHGISLYSLCQYPKHAQNITVSSMLILKTGMGYHYILYTHI